MTSKRFTSILQSLSIYAGLLTSKYPLDEDILSSFFIGVNTTAYLSEDNITDSYSGGTKNQKDNLEAILSYIITELLLFCEVKEEYEMCSYLFKILKKLN